MALMPKKRAKNGLGVFTLVCGLGLMWGGAVRDFKNQGELREALEKSVMIDPAHPDSSKNGRMVVAAGSLTSSTPLGDEFLRPGPYIVLERVVEMFQWTEKWDGGDTGASYKLEWSPGQVDFFSFREPTGHENPLLAISPHRLVAQDVQFSGFDGEKIAQRISPRETLPLEAGLLADPSREIQDDKIIVRRDPTSKIFLLGDMRISYRVAPVGDYTIMAVQRDERNLLGAEGKSDLIIKSGKLDKETFLEQEGQENEKANFSIVYLGASIFWLGLFSLLANSASKLDLRPKLDLTGVPAALFLSFAVSLVVLIVFRVLAIFG